jgi:hypothetical protein
MNQNQNNEDKARGLILFGMRMMDGGYYPTKLDVNKDSELAKLVDRQTAQRIYDEEIARIEKETNVKFPRWDSDKNAPVSGTPKP